MPRPQNTHARKIALELYYAGYEDTQRYMARAIPIDNQMLWLPPTMDQLIDACGDHFGMLQRKIDRHAWTVVPKNEHKDYIAHGPSAWEGVANFWLGLKYAQVL